MRKVGVLSSVCEQLEPIFQLSGRIKLVDSKYLVSTAALNPTRIQM